VKGNLGHATKERGEESEDLSGRTGEGEVIGGGLCARATRGMRRPSLDARMGDRTSSPSCEEETVELGRTGWGGAPGRPPARGMRTGWSIWFFWMNFQSDQPDKPDKRDRPDEPNEPVLVRCAQ